MKEERNILELLTFLRDNIEEYWRKYSHGGLCAYICKLWDENLITTNERVKIFDYIYAHRPNKHVGINSLWWDICELSPRIEFLDKLIEDWKNMSPIERMKALGLFEKDYKHDI